MYHKDIKVSRTRGGKKSRGDLSMIDMPSLASLKEDIITEREVMASNMSFPRDNLIE